jgi:hypothetical protein
MAHLLAAALPGAVILEWEGMPERNDAPYSIGRLPLVGERALILADEDPELRIVYVMRDPRCVLISKHWKAPGQYWVSPDRWIACAQVATAMALMPAYADQARVVKFEDLVCAPLSIESDLLKFFGAKDARKHFDELAASMRCSPEAALTMGGIRALDADRAASYKWASEEDKTYLRGVFECNLPLVNLAQVWGYGTSV